MHSGSAVGDIISLLVGLGVVIFSVIAKNGGSSSSRGADVFTTGGGSPMPPLPRGGADRLDIQRYKSFKCGPFPGTVNRKLSGRNAGGGTFLVTVFGVTIPEAQQLRMKVEMPRSRWAEAMGLSPARFAEALMWDVPDPELKKALMKPANLTKLRKLFSIGPGMVRCEGRNFAVYNLSGVRTPAQLDTFWETARSVFWTFAQVAGMNLPEWRRPENNHDWWAEGEI